MAPELKLTKNVTADKEGAGHPTAKDCGENNSGGCAEKILYVLSADIEAHGHTGGCPGCAAFASHGRTIKPHNDQCRERIRTITERTLTGKARMNAYKTESLRQSECKERERARVERGSGDVRMEPRKKVDEQVAVRHADASGGDITENQHEENRMRDIHIGKRGSETADEEQLDTLRTSVRFEQEAPSALSSTDPHVSLEYLASGEKQDRPGSVFVQSSGHVGDDTNFCVGCVLRNGWTKESLHQRSVRMVSRRRCRRSQEK